MLEAEQKKSISESLNEFLTERYVVFDETRNYFQNCWPYQILVNGRDYITPRHGRMEGQECDGYLTSGHWPLGHACQRVSSTSPLDYTINRPRDYFINSLSSLFT